MSFDIFLQCFRAGEPASFKRALFEEIFGRHAVNPDPPFTDITYADGGAAIHGAEVDDIQHMMFNHCGGDTFFAALHELADCTRSVILWPDEEPCLVAADPAAIENLPTDFTYGRDQVRIVHSGRELEECIFGPR
jgi:hypothetical protein